MAFTFKENTNIIEVINGTDKTILANIELLAKDYLERTGKKVCRSCPSDIRLMILTLKNIYKMTNFEFTRPKVQYKNRKGDKTTISNATMTDEKALNFLKVNPKRIGLFSKYPSDWKKLINGKIETEVEKQKRLAIEAEIAEAEAAKDKAAKEVEVEKPEEVKAEKVEEVKAEKVEEVKAEKVEVKGVPEEATKSKSTPTLADLKKLNLKQLREAYPEVKDTTIKGFVEKVLAL